MENQNSKQAGTSSYTLTGRRFFGKAFREIPTTITIHGDRVHVKISLKTKTDYESRMVDGKMQMEYRTRDIKVEETEFSKADISQIGYKKKPLWYTLDYITIIVLAILSLVTYGVMLLPLAFYMIMFLRCWHMVILLRTGQSVSIPVRVPYSADEVIEALKDPASGNAGTAADPLYAAVSKDSGMPYTGTASGLLQKYPLKTWILAGAGAVILIAVAVAAVFQLTKPEETSPGHTGGTSSLAVKEDESSSKPKQQSGTASRDQTTTAPKKHATVQPKPVKTTAPTQAPTQAPAQTAVSAPDRQNMAGLVKTLCCTTWGGFGGFNGRLTEYQTNKGAFCSTFMVNSIPFVRYSLLQHYSNVYERNGYLYVPEADVLDYLANSLGIADISILRAESYNSSVPEGYSSYANGVFMMMFPDRGDFECQDPVITEMKKVSDSSYQISGSIRNGAYDGQATSLFQLRVTANPDSVWGGYALSGIDRWDTYFLPNSDSAYLTRQDLAGLDAYYLRLARNEIYARHGRRFSDQELQEYFDSCSWYKGSIAPEAFNESTILNQYEIVNRDLIVQYERELGN